MVRSVAGDLPEQVKNNQSVNTAAGNGGQKMSQYSWFTVYFTKKTDMKIAAPGSSPESRYTTTNQNKHSLRIPLDRKAKKLL